MKIDIFFFDEKKQLVWKISEEQILKPMMMCNTVITPIRGALYLAALAFMEPWWMHADLLCTDWFLSRRWKWVRTVHVFSADANGFLSNDTCGDHWRNSYGLHSIKGIHHFQSPALSAEVMTLSYCDEDQCKAMRHGSTRLVWRSGASYDPGVLSGITYILVQNKNTRL